MIVWITGLSGSGKTTLAAELCNLLRKKRQAVILLDGDELREVFGASKGGAVQFSRTSRLQLGLQYGRLCRLIANQGCDVVIATISLFKEVHAWNRDNLSDYFEVYLKVPEPILRQRDAKGLYQSFDEGQVANIAGLDLAIDDPAAPDWAPEYKPENTPSRLANSLMEKLCERYSL